MRLMRFTLTMLLVSAPLLTGCAAKVIIHPIQEVDIHFMKKGETYTSVKDGAFLSDEYLSEVAKANVER